MQHSSEADKILAITNRLSQSELRQGRPIIGITTNQIEASSRLADAYSQAVIMGGGLPLTIPSFTDASLISQTIEQIDGLLLTGGGDLDPSLLTEDAHPTLSCINKNRDIQEIQLVRIAAQRQMPILGICRGHQIINFALGGEIHQDIPSHFTHSTIKHSQSEPKDKTTHTVSITKNSKLHSIVASETLKTNSIHHQAVSVVAPNLVETATTTDGVNEAIEHPHQQIIGVQWHPEALAVMGSKPNLDIFKWLTTQSTIYKRARSVHRNYPIVDSHCDTPMEFPINQLNILERNNNIKVDIPKMFDGKVDAQFMAVYIPQGELTEEAHAEAVAYCQAKIADIKEQIAKGSYAVEQLTDSAKLKTIKQQGKKGIYIAIENGYAIGTTTALLKEYRDLGVSYITLCHNGDNLICDSAKGKATHGGVSQFGREVIEQMNQLGIMVDLSHASEESFYQAIEISKSPIILSHSSCRALCNHPRNLTDKQIKALAKSGGVMQICIYRYFLNEQGEADTQTIVEHIEHVVNLVGIDYVGIGSDFDGGGGVDGCNATNQLINITKMLINRGYGDTDLEKLWGGNILRVLNQTKNIACI